MAKKSTPQISADYNVLTAAIANAALSRAAALNIEACVALLHFTQEQGGADKTGRSNLKAIYQGAGYDCIERKDKDYMTVNRRITVMGKLFDKLGSSLVMGWASDKGDTEATLNYIATELQVYGFHRLDDINEFCGVETSKKRAARQPSGPVAVTAPEPEAEEEAEEVETPAFDQAAVIAAIKANLTADQIRELVTSLLVHVAEVEQSQELKAA